MKVLLFFDSIKYVNTSESSSDWWAIFFSVLVAFGVLMLQQWLEVLRNKKKLLLKLYNLKKHTDHVIEQRDRVMEIFNNYINQIEQTPFDQVMLVDFLIIPDIERMLDIDKNDIFSALVNNQKNNKDAAAIYRKLYNSIEFYKQIFNLLYTTYTRDAEQFYNKRVTIKETCLKIEIQLNKLIVVLGNHLEVPEINEIHNALVAIRNEHLNQQLQKGESYTQQDDFDLMINPILNLTHNRFYTPEIMDIYFDTIKVIRDRTSLIQDVLQTAQFLRGNLGKFPTTVDGLKKINESLSELVQRIEGEKKGIIYRINNLLDI